jgi:hypothetical protein
MTTDLALRPGGAVLDRDAFNLAWELAGRLANTDFVPKGMRGKREAVFAAVLTGRELGIGPMQSLRDIFIQNGRPSMMASLMADRARSAGHRVRVLEQSDKHCVVQVHRRGEPQAEEPVTWTIDDARRANLLSKDNWQHYPRAMLWNRAVAEAIRRDCSEVLGGVLYTPEELDGLPASTVVTAGGAVVDAETGELIDQEPAAEAAPAEGNGQAEPMRHGADVDAWRKRATQLPDDDKERLVGWVNRKVAGGWRGLWRSGTAEDWSAAFIDAGVQTEEGDAS